MPFSGIPRETSGGMKLDLVIPAYNEEAAIESIVRRCLDARRVILQQTSLTDISITVVSDGSSDATEAIARRFEPEITVIAYERNHGYGAAIRTGFAAGNGELVGFLDTDGTCDPMFFAPLVNELVRTNASVSVGSRMTDRSKMPAIRKLGNRMWRAIINWMAQADIGDAASGMRVIRRDALPILEPLPDGLHYTPTMSCRAALDARLSIVEVPMTYEERVGRSKLRVIRDGLRFLKTILDVGLTYQPFRLISVPGMVLLVVAVLLFAPVVVGYAATRRIPEGEIYRILAALVAAVGGLQMFLAGIAGERVVSLVHPKKWQGGWFLRLFRRLATQKKLLVVSAALFVIAFALNAAGIWSYVRTGYVWEHWSRAAIGGMLVLIGVQCFAAAVLDRMLGLLGRIQCANG